MPWLTTRELAKREGVTLETVQAWVAKGVYDGAIRKTPGGAHFRIWIDDEASSDGNAAPYTSTSPAPAGPRK